MYATHANACAKSHAKTHKKSIKLSSYEINRVSLFFISKNTFAAILGLHGLCEKLKTSLTKCLDFKTLQALQKNSSVLYLIITIILLYENY